MFAILITFTFILIISFIPVLMLQLYYTISALSSCTTSYEISVRQTRDLPVSQFTPHIQLPSDSTSRWTPLPSAISFPLPGGFGTLTLKKRAPLGAHWKSHTATPCGYVVTTLLIYVVTTVLTLFTTLV